MPPSYPLPPLRSIPNSALISRRDLRSLSSGTCPTRCAAIAPSPTRSMCAPTASASRDPPSRCQFRGPGGSRAGCSGRSACMPARTSASSSELAPSRPWCPVHLDAGDGSGCIPDAGTGRNPVRMLRPYRLDRAQHARTPTCWPFDPHHPLLRRARQLRLVSSGVARTWARNP